jgi:hypothetical protein
VHERLDVLGAAPEVGAAAHEQHRGGDRPGVVEPAPDAWKKLSSSAPSGTRSDGGTVRRLGRWPPADIGPAIAGARRAGRCRRMIPRPEQRGRVSWRVAAEVGRGGGPCAASASGAGAEHRVELKPP